MRRLAIAAAALLGLVALTACHPTDRVTPWTAASGFAEARNPALGGGGGAATIDHEVFDDGWTTWNANYWWNVKAGRTLLVEVPAGTGQISFQHLQSPLCRTTSPCLTTSPDRVKAGIVAVDADGGTWNATDGPYTHCTIYIDDTFWPPFTVYDGIHEAGHCAFGFNDVSNVGGGPYQQCANGAANHYMGEYSVMSYCSPPADRLPTTADVLGLWSAGYLW
jgi:hypothetical protein